MCSRGVCWRAAAGGGRTTTVCTSPLAAADQDQPRLINTSRGSSRRAAASRGGGNCAGRLYNVPNPRMAAADAGCRRLRPAATPPPPPPSAASCSLDVAVASVGQSAGWLLRERPRLTHESPFICPLAPPLYSPRLWRGCRRSTNAALPHRMRGRSEKGAWGAGAVPRAWEVPWASEGLGVCRASVCQRAERLWRWGVGGGGGRGQGRREANSRTGESPRRDGGRRSLPPSSLGRARGHERPRRPFDGEMQKTRDARGRR